MRVVVFPCNPAGAAAAAADDDASSITTSEADDYIGRNVADQLQDLGHEVIRISRAAGLDGLVERVLGGSSGGSSGDEDGNGCDAVVVGLFGNEAAVEQLAARMAAAATTTTTTTTTSRPCVLVAITTPLAWALTPPLPGGQQQRYSAERDAASSQPAACAAAAHRTARAVLCAARAGRLATHVVCPGVLYGRGEGRGHLLPALRAAWANRPLAQFGPGTNRIPTLAVGALAGHVAALMAASLAAVAAAAAAAAVVGKRCVSSNAAASMPTAAAAAPPPPPPPYVLVADPVPVTQSALLQAISTAFGSAAAPVKSFPLESFWEREATLCDFDGAGQERSAALALACLDLPLATTPLASTTASLQQPAATADHQQQQQQQPNQPSSGSEGILDGRLASIAAEFVKCRRLDPVHLLVVGPPAAGKSHLAARIAAARGIRHVTAADILAEGLEGGGNTAVSRALAAELAGRDGRASDATMAAALRELAGRDPRLARCGYVLDGWPRSTAQARLAFAACGDSSSGSGSGSGSAANAASDAGIDKKKLAAPQKDAAQARKLNFAKNEAGPVVSAGKVEQQQQQATGSPAAAVAGSVESLPLPKVAVVLHAPRSELARRVKCLAACEAARAQRLDTAAAVPAGKPPVGAAPPSSRAVLKRVGTINGNGGGSSSSSSSANNAAAAVAAGVGGRPSHNTERDFTRRYAAWRVSCGGTATSSGDDDNDRLSPAELVAVLTAGGQCHVVEVDNACDATVSAMSEPWSPSLPGPPPLACEAAIQEALGPPRGFVGGGPPAASEGSAGGGGQPLAAGDSGGTTGPQQQPPSSNDAAAAAPPINGSLDARQQQQQRTGMVGRAEAAAAAAAGRDGGAWDYFAAAGVGAALAAALADCVAKRPADPIKALGLALMAKAAARVPGPADPYDAPAYVAAEAKARAKAVRHQTA